MSIPRDQERIGRIRAAIEAEGLGALVCALPSDVLLLSGYWPVIGNSIAVATREGAVGLVVPEDERDLATESWADEIRVFEGASLKKLAPITEAVCRTLKDLPNALHLPPDAKIGLEGGVSYDPASYPSTFVYGAGLPGLLHHAWPTIKTADATQLLARLRSLLTPREIHELRRACQLAREAFEQTVPEIRAGMAEFEVAGRVRSRLYRSAGESGRCDGAAFCMSGPDSYRAYAAFQRTGARRLSPGDFVLIHCNSYCGGFWTDITRTFTLGEPSPRQAAITDAVLEARRHALDVIRPGVKASAVDRTAREVLEARGFGKEFKHATGHGVGFAAINHDALPLIHPLYDEPLKPGMVFNVEPAVYIEGLGGMRHCDMVLVTQNGAEVLTPFQSEGRELVIV